MKKVTCKRCKNVGKATTKDNCSTYFCKITKVGINPFITEKTIECIYYKRRR